MSYRNTEPRLISLAMTILFGLGGVWVLASPWAPAQDGLQIATTVPLRSQIEQMENPIQLALAPEDVARGWVELPAVSRLTVYNNCESGYRLILEVVDAPWLGRFLVRAQGRETWVLNDGGSMLFPWEGAGRKLVDVSYRFELRAGTPPGIYPWPLRLSAGPAVPQ